MVNRIAASAVLIGAVLTLTLRAQQQRPEFRSGIDLVTLDLTAIGPDGWPLTDLRPEELTLTVRGRARPIRSFEYVEVAPRTPAAAGSPSLGVSPAPASNLQTTGGRSVFILVLHDHIRPGNERQALQGAARFIDQLMPRDRVAVITMPFGRVEADLTTDHKMVKARLSKIVGHSLQAVPTGNLQTSEGRAVVDFLKQIAPLDGPKTVVLISEGFNGDGGSVFATTDPAKDPLQPETGAAAMTDMAAAIDGVTGLRSAAQAARAQFFVIQPNNNPADASFKPREDEGIDTKHFETIQAQTAALGNVAAVTGGQFFRLSGTATAVFDRILRESSGYYALAFEADEVDRTGKDQTVLIRTSRPGVTLRVRRTFARTSSAPPTSASPSAPVSAKDMLKDRTPHRDLPLQATAFTSRAPDGKVKVLAVVETVQPAPLAEIAFALVDGANKVVAAWPADVPAAAGPVVAAQVVSPGHYRLRAAAVDATGRGGAADYEFDATLTSAGALQAGSLMLGTVSADGRFQPRLAFASGDAAAPYFEIYGSTIGVTVTFELHGASGTAAISTTPANIAPTRDADRRIATGSLILPALPPGEYVMRALIAAGGRELGVLSASLRLVAR